MFLLQLMSLLAEERSMAISTMKTKLSSCFWTGLRHALARGNAAVHLTDACILLFHRRTSYPPRLVEVLSLKNFKKILGFCGSGRVPA